MGQVTIYLEDEIESKMVEAAQSAHLSKSKWIAQVIKEKVDSQWPLSVQEAAGSWEDDFPNAEQMRENIGKDAKRETL
ncbi:MAG TPA: CopG family transcriptional regulator [Oceanospirillales bacterium]|nr:CopG family transcriptional regulator [Oceanospirillales bacterium]